MDKKILVIGVVVIVVAVGAFLLLGSNKTTAPAAGGAPTSSGNTGAGQITNCSSDQTCLSTNFIACSPATFSMPFVQGEYAVRVIGSEGDKCHYNISTLALSMDCLVPKELMTMVRFMHTFGADKELGSEQVLANQTSLDTMYCTEKASSGTPDEGIGTSQITNCSSDQSCLRTNFIACSPTVFSMTVSPGVEYVFQIVGSEGDKCRYNISETRALDLDCLMPKEMMTNSRFAHYLGLGADNTSKQDLAYQNSLDEEYCTIIIIG